MGSIYRRPDSTDQASQPPMAKHRKMHLLNLKAMRPAAKMGLHNSKTRLEGQLNGQNNSNSRYGMFSAIDR